MKTLILIALLMNSIVAIGCKPIPLDDEKTPKGLTSEAE